MTAELFVDKKSVKFVWWDMSDPEMIAMMGMMSTMGWENCRLEWYPEHPDGTDDNPSRFIVVDARTGEQCGSFNVSQFCPPICP